MGSALNHVTRGMTRQLQVQLSFLGMEDDDLFHTLDTGQSAPHGLPVELPSLPVFLQTIGLLLVLPLLVWLADAVVSTHAFLIHLDPIKCVRIPGSQSGRIPHGAVVIQGALSGRRIFITVTFAGGKF